MKTFLSLATLLASLSLFAQQTKTPSSSYEECGFDAIHKNLLLTDPSYKQKAEDFELLVKKGLQNSKAGPPYKVPVVVHVMHKGEAVGAGSNISEAAINQGIRELNDRFRKVPGSLGDGNGVDVEMEFALAVRDPNGNCTNGIVRFDMTAHNNYMNNGLNRNNINGMDEATLKALSRWTATEYYNIYLVSEIDNNNCGSGIQGFAYFASAHGSAVDGMVQLGCKFALSGNTTLTHEIGHAMNLYHTFEGDGGGGNCPANTACATTGDRCCDTPRHRRSTSNCNTGATNACTGGLNDLHVHNYMDYSSDLCQSEFTADQKTRATLALTVTRASFLEDNGNLSLVPPGAAVVDFTASSTAVCLGTPISFYDESFCIPNTGLNGGWLGMTFSWTFDNGVNPPVLSTNQNPTINFANPGTYSVTLTITDPFGTNTITKPAYVFIASGSPSVACVNGIQNVGNFGYGLTNVDFNTISNSTSPSNNGYSDFSCTDITIVDVGMNYTLSVDLSAGGSQQGFYEAYIDYDDDGAFAAAEQIMSGVLPGGSANTVTANVLIPGTAVTNKLLRMRVIYDQFSLSGPCKANLFTGESEDYGVYINPNSPPVADFNTNLTTLCEGDSINFTDLSTNAPTQWAWNFTGGTPATSVLQNPTNVIYATAGTYQVQLIATNAFGSDTMVKVAYITVNSCAIPPVADFSASDTTLCVGDSINFTDLSTINPTQWAWSFAGGTPAVSTIQNPTNIIYPTIGTYQVQLIATNAFGSDTIVKLTHIDVASCAFPPVADFVADTVTVCEGDSVNYTDLSTNNPTQWAWAFAGGTPAVSTVQNPMSIFYNTAGTFQTELIATNGFGLDTVVKAAYINVTVCAFPPVADFTAVNTTLCEGDATSFTDLSTNAPTQWAWSFVGGTPATSTAQNPTNIAYAAAGNYQVQLIATNGFGVDTIVKVAYITVNTCVTAPVANFSFTTDTICEGDLITFTDLSINSPSQWNWTFAGGTPATSNAQNPPNIAYATAGVYQVNLIASNAFGNDAHTIYVTVNDCSPPVADFTPTNLVLCEGDSISFTDLTSKTPTQWNWTFAGGLPSTSVLQNPTNIVYATAGTYQAQLTATNAYGTHAKTIVITVNSCPPPIATIIMDDVDGEICVNGCIDFSYDTLIGGPPTTVNWTFPGGTPSTSTSLNPGVVCWNDTTGTFSVSVVVTNDYGVSNASVTVVVHEMPVLDAGRDVTISIGRDTIINAQATDTAGNYLVGGSYEWSPLDLLTCPYCPSTGVTQPLEKELYTVVYTDEWGCVVSDDVWLDVEMNHNIGVPSAFSPNGDGSNDVLYVKGKVIIESLNFIVYNRYGQQVFSTTNKERGWNGQHNGQDLNPGVFVYSVYVTFIDGTEGKLKGNVTLVR